MASKKKDLVKGILKKPGNPTTYGTDPNDPWSAKLGITENITSRRSELLKKFYKAKGYNINYVSKNQRVGQAKTGEFDKWKSDHGIYESEDEICTRCAADPCICDDSHGFVDVKEGRMSAAEKLSRAFDKQRAKSDASLRRTPSSIPKKDEPKQGVAEGKDPTTDSAQDARGSHLGDVKKNKDGSYVATNQAGSRKIFKNEQAAKAHANSGQQAVAEGSQKWYPDAPVNDYAGHEYHKLSDTELERKRADQKERHEKLGDTNAGKNADIARGIQVHRVRQAVAEDNINDPQCATQSPFDGANTTNDVAPKKSKAGKMVKEIYAKSRLKEDLYDHEKDDKGPGTYGKAPKVNKKVEVNDTDEKGVNARMVLKGGTTLTGEKRDTIEIDPMLKNRSKTADYLTQDPKKEQLRTK